jgi:hypothetical protein
MSKKRRRSKYSPRLKIGGQWVAHQVALIRTLRELSFTARRILDTLEMEHCRHGGRENGKLICTYTDLKLGADITSSNAIARGLRELERYRLIKIQRGRRAFADMRFPSVYTLTYLHTYQDGKEVAPTHDWKQKASIPSDTGASIPSDTGTGQKPVSKMTLQGGDSQYPQRYNHLDLGWKGGGGAADFSSLLASPPAHHQEGAGPSAPPPPLPNDEPPSVTAPSSGRLH